MVVKIYISGISGNKEVKKRQQRVSMILDSRNIKYELVDIAEPDNEAEKDYMQGNSTSLGATIGDASPRHPLPPQIFNDKEYCGDYDQFDLSNEIDELDKFLKIAPADDTTVTSTAEVNLSSSTVTSGATVVQETDVTSQADDDNQVTQSNEAEAVNGAGEEAEAEAETIGDKMDVVENGDVTESTEAAPDATNDAEEA